MGLGGRGKGDHSPRPSSSRAWGRGEEGGRKLRQAGREGTDEGTRLMTKEQRRRILEGYVRVRAMRLKFSGAPKVAER